jgi:cobalt-zinc-cadmium efflux system outer membrane protein
VWRQVDSGNPEVQGRLRALASAQADVTTAALTPPPQFSLLSQAIDPHQFAGDLWHKQVDTIASLSVSYERGNKLKLREAQAQAGLTASQLDVWGTRWQQRVAAAQAYWGLKLAQEQVDTSARHAALAEASSRAAQARLQQGDVSRLEATRLAVEAHRTENDLGVARDALLQAQFSLAQLLNRSADAARLQAVAPWPRWRENVTGDTGDVDAYPSVQAAQARLDQAQRALVLAQAQRLTAPTLSVQCEHHPPDGARRWGVGISFPLGMDGRQDGRVRKAMVARDDAQAQLDLARQQLRDTLRQQQQAASAAAQRAQRTDTQLLPQAREALQAAEYAHQQGAIGLQDLLDARHAVTSADLDSATAHAALAQAMAVLTTPFPPRE